MTDHHEPAVRSHRVASLADIADNTVTKVTVDGRPIALASVEGELYAIDDTCSHADFSLSDGELDPIECALECPKHGALFSLRNGEALSLPATSPVQAHTVEVLDGEVLVSLPDAAANESSAEKGHDA